MKFPVLLLLTAVFSLSLSAQITISSAPTDFAGLAMDGSKVDTAALRGKIVVLNLWFINCPDCIEEIKLLNQLVEDYKGHSDVVFLAPAASRKPELEKFLVKNPFRYQVIPNASMIILTKFGTADERGEIKMPFPMHVILGRDGKVTLKMRGIKGVAAVRTELEKQLQTAKTLP